MEVRVGVGRIAQPILQVARGEMWDNVVAENDAESVGDGRDSGPRDDPVGNSDECGFKKPGSIRHPKTR